VPAEVTHATHRRDTAPARLSNIDLSQVAVAKRNLDTVGHYSRPDLFTLHVNTRPMRPVEFHDRQDSDSQ